jgi:hypothetical protein
MAQSLNQRKITNEPGRATFSQSTPFTFSERIDPTYDSAIDGVITSGAALKPSGSGNYLIPATANTDDIIGFILYDGVKNNFDGGDIVEVVRNPGVLNLEAGAALPKETALEYNVATKKVIAQTTGTLIGYNIKASSADGEIIPVIIRTK